MIHRRIFDNVNACRSTITHLFDLIAASFGSEEDRIHGLVHRQTQNPR